MFVGNLVELVILGPFAAAGLGGTFRAAYCSWKLRSFDQLAVPLIVVVSLASLMTPPVFLAGIYTRSLIEIPTYRSAIELKGPDSFPKCTNSDACEQDGQWIIFSWGGFLDNWSGVVYDPSGTIETAPKDHKSAFGGDLISVRHLWGAWYYCGFT